jgi:hypothetical protein
MRAEGRASGAQPADRGWAARTGINRSPPRVDARGSALAPSIRRSECTERRQGALLFAVLALVPDVESSGNHVPSRTTTICSTVLRDTLQRGTTTEMERSTRTDGFASRC